MGLKTSGDTMQSPNNSSRRCAHVSVIFSPPGFALPMVGAGREAIVFTARYVMQRGAKAGHTVGLGIRTLLRPQTGLLFVQVASVDDDLAGVLGKRRIVVKELSLRLETVDVRAPWQQHAGVK